MLQKANLLVDGGELRPRVRKGVLLGAHGDHDVGQGGLDGDRLPRHGVNFTPHVAQLNTDSFRKRIAPLLHAVDHGDKTAHRGGPVGIDVAADGATMALRLLRLQRLRRRLLQLLRWLLRLMRRLRLLPTPLLRLLPRLLLLLRLLLLVLLRLMVPPWRQLLLLLRRVEILRLTPWLHAITWSPEEILRLTPWLHAIRWSRRLHTVHRVDRL